MSKKHQPNRDGGVKTPAHDMPRLRCVALVREQNGFRTIVADIPADVVREHMIRNHEPNLREVAEDKAIRALEEPFR